jgi:hypothetical protein
MTISKCVDVHRRTGPSLGSSVERVDDFDHGPGDEIPGAVWYVREHR